MRFTKYLGLIALIGAALWLCWASAGVVQSQTQVLWASARRVPDYLDTTMPPVLVADQNKTVFAFAHQLVGEEPQKMAIVFRRWTVSGGWSPPNDVLLSPFGEAAIYDAYLDPDGIVHLIFQGGNAQNSNIYYASAPIAEADRAPAWTRPLLLGSGTMSPRAGAIQGDGQGNLVVLFTGLLEGQGVYATYSRDGGVSWGDATPLFFTFDPQLVPFSLNMIKDDNDQIHAVWNVINVTGVDQALYYTRFSFIDTQWSEIILLDERIDRPDYFGPSFPEISASGSNLVVLYNSGNPMSGEVDAGRPVMQARVSHDLGQTWDNPTGPFPAHLGRSGTHALVSDSAGAIHALFIQRIEAFTEQGYQSTGGIWHSSYQDGSWSEPDLFDLGEMSGHDLEAVVSQGNVLLVTWREDPGVGNFGVWYSSTVLDAPELPIVIPDPVTRPSPTAAPVVVLETPTLPPEATPTTTPIPVAILSEQPPFETSISGDPARPLVYGIIPVLIILVLIIVVQQIRLRRP